MRLDSALALHEEIRTRNRAQHLIDDGAVRINGVLAKSSLRLKAGDLIELEIAPKSEVSKNHVPQANPLDVIFEDLHLLVVNKPAGMVVHPGAGHSDGTLVNFLLHHTSDLSMKFGEDRPGIVHRLDRDTSGLLVVAKNDLTHEALAQQFKEKTTNRHYEAVVVGEVNPLSGTVRSHLARSPSDRKKFASIEKRKVGKSKREQPPAIDQGKLSVTHFRRLSTSRGLSLLELKLETGRTHQIRVHLTEMGFPILGDQVYSLQKNFSVQVQEAIDQIQHLKRFLLHAKSLGFEHPITKERMKFEVPWPGEIPQLLKWWGLAK